MPRRPSSIASSSAYASPGPLVQKWLLRILVPLGGHERLIQPDGFRDDALAKIAGLGDYIDRVDAGFDPTGARRELRRLHRSVERKCVGATAPTCLQQNVARLATVVGLSPVDCRILEFAVLVHSDRLLDHATIALGNLSSTEVFFVLAQLLDLSEGAVRTALGGNSPLGRSGLVRFIRSGEGILRAKIDLLSDHFADQILTIDGDPIALLRNMVAPAMPGHLAMADFEHIARWLTVLRPYITSALASGRRGVNILLWGDPGTGKNQLSRVLAKEVNCELFEVTSEDSDGDPINGERRLRAFRAAQSFFGQRRSLLVFDEIGDVFNDDGGILGSPSTAQTRKAWINRMLEDNPVPTLWLSNSIHGLDNAFIRRFDMVIELPIPPKAQRERIVRAACPDFLDAAVVARLAESERLAPAVITRAAAVVSAISAELGPNEAAKAVELLVSGTLEAQGYASIRSHAASQLPEIYAPAFINADADLGQVATGLGRTRMGRLCLYGPPGTGKTAYARWLADGLGVPLLVKRASDILSMYVGEDEKNIARAFRQAVRDGAVLLLDEVDSFLQDRRSAVRSWEVTLVNEMLTQMESFPGIFIASTNLMDGLDQASLRRFDLKVKFNFLRTEQAWALLQRHCEVQGLPAPTTSQSSGLAALTNLAPGDFAAVARQHRFRELRSAADWVDALAAECAIKGGAKTAIGFC